LGARDEAALESLAEEVSNDETGAIAVPTDGGDAAAIEHLVAATVSAFGRLDVAFNNAAGGGQPPTPLADLPVDAYDSAIAITLRSVFLSMKFEIPAMLAAGGAGVPRALASCKLGVSTPSSGGPSTWLSMLTSKVGSAGGELAPGRYGRLRLRRSNSRAHAARCRDTAAFDATR